MNIGYIVDSSCGLSQKEAEKRGWIYLPIILSINGKEYSDGVDLIDKKFYETIKMADICKTAATPPGIVIEAFKKASAKFDQVIVYGLSTELSSQSSNLMNFAKEYKNIKVVDSKGVGEAIVKDLESVANFDDVDKAFAKLNELSKSQWGLVFPKELQWLVRGGRISPAIANMANLLKIVPIIKLENGALEKVGKGRVYSKTILKSLNIFIKDHPDKEYIIYHGKYEGMEKDIANIEKTLGPCEKKYFPPTIACHTCPEVIAIMARVKTED